MPQPATTKLSWEAEARLFDYLESDDRHTIPLRDFINSNKDILATTPAVKRAVQQRYNYLLSKITLSNYQRARKQAHKKRAEKVRERQLPSSPPTTPSHRRTRPRQSPTPPVHQVHHQNATYLDFSPISSTRMASTIYNQLKSEEDAVPAEDCFYLSLDDPTLNIPGVFALEAKFAEAESSTGEHTMRELKIAPYNFGAKFLGG
jgi:hypothetical protein